MKERIEKMYQEWAENHDHSDGVDDVFEWLHANYDDASTFVDYQDWVDFKKEMYEEYDMDFMGPINYQCQIESWDYLERLMKQYGILETPASIEDLLAIDDDDEDFPF